MSMSKIEGYAPDNTCRSCEHLGVGTGNYNLGCNLGEVRFQEKHFPYIEACNNFSNWYANTAKAMIAIAQEWTDNPGEAIVGFLMEGVTEDSED